MAGREAKLDPNLSSLAQQLTHTQAYRTKRAKVARIGSIAASEKLHTFSDEEKGIFLDKWTDEHTARLVVELCRVRAQMSSTV